VSSEGDKIMYDESKHVAVKGFVVVNVGVTGAGINKVQWWSHYPVEESFYVVPAGSALTITDVVVNTEQLRAPETVAIDDLFPDNEGGELILELRVAPNSLPQAHFLTGYVIQPGHSVIANTTVPITPPPNQAILLWLTGYIPKPWVFWWTKAARTRKPMIRPNVPRLAR
jgi:hypothetical protein